MIARLRGLGGGKRLTQRQFLRRFRAKDGRQLGLALLADAIERRDSIDVEWSFSVCYSFGFTTEHVDLLHELAFVDWHISHEDVAWELDMIGSVASVPYLKHLAVWIPDHLAWDEHRALSTKAVWGIAKMDHPVAREAIIELSHNPDPHVAHAAQFQIQRLRLAGY